MATPRIIYHHLYSGVWMLPYMCVTNKIFVHNSIFKLILTYLYTPDYWHFG